MKTKYERMNRHEKKELYTNYKKEKVELGKKMERMFFLCRVGIIYSVIMFFYDLYKKSSYGYIIDFIVFIFCILSLFKLYSIKKEVLNKYSLEKGKK